MIDEYIISLGSCSNSINSTCGFNTKAHSSKKEVLMNKNVRNECYNDKENIR
jgi:hypothetical protein